MPSRSGVERHEPPLSCYDRVLRGEVRLGQQEAVGEGGLFDCLRMLVDLPYAVQRIDRRHHGVEADKTTDQRIVQEELNDRSRIGKAVVSTRIREKGGISAPVSPNEQVRQRLLQIARTCSIRTVGSTAISPSMLRPADDQVRPRRIRSMMTAMSPMPG